MYASNSLGAVLYSATIAIDILVGMLRGRQREIPSLPTGRVDKLPDHAGSLVDRLIASHDVTPRELAVLRLLPHACTNRQIAESLLVTVNTIKPHVQNICRKLNAARRRHAVALVLDKRSIY